jgi:hypothetical protein
MPGKRFGAQLSELDDAALAQARELREAGRTYAEIAEHLAVSANFVGTLLGGSKDEPMSDSQLAAIRAAMPPDSRTFGERWLGSPIPGRSALDAPRVPEISEATRLRARRIGVSPWLYRRLAAEPHCVNLWGRNLWGRVARHARSQKFNSG